MTDVKKSYKAEPQLRCISFGGDLFKFQGYMALPEGKNKKAASDVGSIKDFKGIKANSICSVKFIYTLERMGNDCDPDENFVALMSELYRVCADGALVEIKTARDEFIKSEQDPLIVRKIDDKLLRLLDASWREQQDTNGPFGHTLNAFNKAGIDFMKLKALAHLSDEARAHLEGQTFSSESELYEALSGFDNAFIANSYFFACRKTKDFDYGLVKIPEIDHIPVADNSKYNESLPEGIRGCDLDPYLMHIYNTQNNENHLYVSRQIKEMGYWELPETLTFARLLSMFASKYPKFKFANIGANIGWYTILAGKFTSHVVIDAFEPTPETFSYLKHNIRINQLEKRINPINLALSDSKGECDFFLNSDNPGNNAIVAYEYNKEMGAEFTKITIQTETMDNYYMSKDKSEWPNMILIDTEGHEQQVFDGAKQLFENGFRPLIVAEFCPPMLDLRGRPTYFKDMVAKYGYSIFVINQDAEHPVSAATVEYLDQLYDKCVKDGGDAGYTNIILVPDYFEVKDGSMSIKM